MQAQQIAQQKAAALGASINPENIQQARAKGQGKVTPQQTTPYYIFNFADHAGYAVVGGDDRMPAIVGYSDRGTLNTDSLPENLKSFLAAYKATVEAVEKGDSSAVKNVKAAMKRVAGSYTPVSPLLGEIVWNQSAPFNNLCPKYDGEHTAVTGCVATAMAQIMRYWKYPSSLLEDIPAYTSQGYNIPIESIQKGIGYDWDNMLENYNDSYTPEQAVAVATLMQHVGASVKMQYGSQSGAYDKDVVSALTQYFGYDKNIIKFLERANFEWEDWNKILQDELGKKRPIYYSGQSSSGGHAFVCDGMDADGYYHINWGWGGTSNDYFDITILNPNVRGAGASASSNGYNNYNLAIVGIVPDEAQDKQPSFVYDRFVVTNYNLTCSTQRQSASDSFSGTASYTLTCLDKDLQATFTIGIKNEKGDIVPISSERQTMYVLKNEAQNINVTFNYALPVGAYKIFAIQSTDNGKTWQTCYGTHPMYYVTDTELFTNQIVDFSDDDFKYQLDVLNLKACANSYLGNKTDVVVPKEVTYKDKKYAVTKVGPSCFNTSNSSIVKNVTLSEGITDLGEITDSWTLMPGEYSPMFDNTSLESIDLPKSLVTIGDGCFASCPNLQVVNIPKDSHLEIVGRNCFSNCTKLEEISFPKSLKEFRGELWRESSNGFITIIGGTFYQCSNLKTITFDDECPLESFPMYCFNECINLTSINIPSSMKTLGMSCFDSCIYLKNIIIPSSIKVIGVSCFSYCYNLSGTLIIPKGVTELGASCFFDCRNLREIKIPKGVTELGASCFFGCHNLREIEIPEGVTKIPNDCFTVCDSITKIILPSTICELGTESFSNCEKLKSLVIPEGVTKIPDRCFMSCRSLTNISLPSSIRELGVSCFENCDKLKELVIPEGVTKIPIRCFAYCGSLTSMNIPSSIRELGESCFKNCRSWKGRIIIPEGVTKIPNACFNGCSSLTSISLPSTIRELGESSFEHCDQWKGEVVIPEGVTEIPIHCFYFCLSLTSITLPSTIRKLDDQCFYACAINNDIVIPEGVTKLPSSCFGCCGSIRNISLPSTLEEIGNECFFNCHSLTNMNFPNNISKLGKSCFYACWNWTGDIVIPEGTTQIPRSCFEGCHALSSISLPSTLQQLDSCSIVCSARMKEMKLKLADVPENLADAINHGEWRSWPDYSQASTKNFLTLYVPASSVEAYKQAVGQYFKAILPLAETGINQPSLDGIAISASYGNIVISGLTDGTPVKLYAVDGKYIGESIAYQGSVSFNCSNEKMVIAKIGSKSMKIAVSR